MEFKAYYDCILKLDRKVPYLEQVWFDYYHFDLNGEEISLDIGEADGFDNVPDKNGCLYLAGSFDCTCDEDFDLDETFNPTNLDPIFTFFDRLNNQVYYEVVEAGLTVYTDDGNRLYFKERHC